MKLIVCLFFLLAAVPASAQAPLPVDTADTAQPHVPDTLGLDSMAVDTSGSPIKASDTILFVPPPGRGEVPVTDTINLERRLKQNPTAALFKSLVVPGWGQLGNGRVVKAAGIIALDAWFVGAIIHYGRQASQFKDNYEAAAAIETRNMWYGLYEDRKQERTKYVFFLGVATLLSVFDAYVDAHLSGSPMDREERPLSFDVGSDGDTPMRASLTWRF